MFFCELPKGHDGEHHRERKSGYPRAYVRVNGVGYTFHGIAKPR